MVDSGIWVVGLFMAMLLLQYARTVPCLCIWLLGVWCGCGASYTCVPLFASCPLIKNVMTNLWLQMGQQHGLGWDSRVWILGAAVWWLFLCEWPTMQWSPTIWTGDLGISGIGIHDAILDCLLCISFKWLWLNSYRNAFS